jgi:4-hydroxy-2-oxoheptanedioate aldolase
MDSSSGLRNSVKDKFARGEPVFSMSVRLVRSIEIASIARTAGFDSIYIDLEHSSFSLDTTGQICMACLPLGVAPFVRVPGGDPHFVARVLDAGALGIIAPHLHSADEARAIVRAAKYPPVGDRSLAGMLPQLQFRTLPTATASRQLNDSTMVIAMIESKEGLAAVGEIAAVEGIDVLFIGTNDLCNSLGIPGELDHELVRAAYRKTWEACRASSKVLGVGGLSSRPDIVRRYLELGARYVSAGTDISFLAGAAALKRQQMSLDGSTNAPAAATS